MKRRVLFLLIFLITLALLIAACGGDDEDEPDPTATVTPSPTATLTNTPTITPTPSATSSPAPTDTVAPTETPAPTITPTAETIAEGSPEIMVNTLQDGVDCAEICSLRGAILLAEPGQTIVFAEDLAGIALLGGLLEIDKSITIVGPGADVLALSTTYNGHVFHIVPRVNVTISGFTLQESSNSGGGGGAIFNEGTLVIYGVTFARNWAYGGGALSNQGTLTITDSTFALNEASADTNGAAIENRGAEAVATITNTTFTQNATGGGRGAAIANVEGGQVSLINSTIAGNRAGGGIFTDETSTTTLTNSLLAQNAPVDIGGPVVSAGGNFIANVTDVAGLLETDIQGGDPSLDVLSENGGATLSLALREGSPAIGIGIAEACPEADQRGVTRHSPCDAGAYDGGADAGYLTSIDHEAIIAALPEAERINLTDALILDGIAQYIEIPYFPEADVNEMTIEAWIKPTAPIGDFDGVLAGGRDSVRYSFHLTGAQGLGFAPVTSPAQVSPSALQPDVWQHIGLTYGNGHLVFYVNGRAMPVPYFINFALASTGQPLIIGVDLPGGAEYFMGQIAEVRLWDRARMADELAETRYIKLQGNEEGLVGYWPLDDVADGTAADLANGHDGVLKP